MKNVQLTPAEENIILEALEDVMDIENEETYEIISGIQSKLMED